MKTVVLPNSTIALLNDFVTGQRYLTICWSRKRLMILLSFLAKRKEMQKNFPSKKEINDEKFPFWKEKSDICKQKQYIL